MESRQKKEREPTVVGRYPAKHEPLVRKCRAMLRDQWHEDATISDVLDLALETLEEKLHLDVTT